MAQFQCMDTSLDTLSDKLFQVNTRVGRIARHQAKMGGCSVPSTSVASADESDGFGSTNDADDATASDDEDDRDISSPNDDKMST